MDELLNIGRNNILNLLPTCPDKRSKSCRKNAFPSLYQKQIHAQDNQMEGRHEEVFSGGYIKYQ